MMRGYWFAGVPPVARALNDAEMDANEPAPPAVAGKWKLIVRAELAVLYCKEYPLFSSMLPEPASGLDVPARETAVPPPLAEAVSEGPGFVSPIMLTTIPPVVVGVIAEPLMECAVVVESVPVTREPVVSNAGAVAAPATLRTITVSPEPPEPVYVTDRTLVCEQVNVVDVYPMRRLPEPEPLERDVSVNEYVFPAVSEMAVTAFASTTRVLTMIRFTLFELSHVTGILIGLAVAARMFACVAL